MTTEEQDILRDFVRRVTLVPKEIALPVASEDSPAIVWAVDTQLRKACKRGTLQLPNLHTNESLFVASDYGGEHREGSFTTFSVLVAGLNSLGYFYEAQQKWRAEHKLLTSKKEIAFKTFRSGPLSRGLDGYLINLDNFLPGILFTVVIDKTLQSLFAPTRRRADEVILSVLKSEGFTRWKGHVAEKAVNVVHLVSYLVALLSRPDQKVFWMTDNDAIAANIDTQKDLGLLFSRLLHHYCPHAMGQIGHAVPFVPRDIQTLDVLSAADIAAGSLEHSLTRKQRDGESSTVYPEAAKVLRWLAHQGVMLKKFSIVLRSNASGLQAGTLDLIADKLPEDARTIWI